MSKSPVRPRTQRDFSNAVWTLWSRVVEDFFAMGQALIEAKAALSHGDFMDLFDGPPGMPFGIDKAERLMAIARHPMLSRSDVRRILPASWTTLYELSRVPEPRLLAAMDAGEITPGLQEHQARALWRGAPEKVPDYALFRCGGCGKKELLRVDSRPSAYGEEREIQPRLYSCRCCGLTTLTEEVSKGLYSKHTLPKAAS